MIIDFHAHLPWIQEDNFYNVEECQADMAENKIDCRVISALQGYDITVQNNVIAQLVQKDPTHFIGCAVIDPKMKNVMQELQRITTLGCFPIIELDSYEHNYDPIHTPYVNEIMHYASEHHLVVNVFTGWGCHSMPAQWAVYAKRYPELRMVLLHMGGADFGYGCVSLVSQVPNLYVETSCMYELPILRKALRMIPKERFLFGSHYPDKFTCCALHTLDVLQLDISMQEALFYQNASRLLAWGKEGNNL